MRRVFDEDELFDDERSSCFEETAVDLLPVMRVFDVFNFCVAVVDCLPDVAEAEETVLALRESETGDMETVPSSSSSSSVCWYFG
jgi:hypothetical protein